VSIGAPDDLEPLLALDLPVGSRVVVVGDLLLRRRSTASSDRITTELSAVIAELHGPGAVVLNGSFLDLLGDPRSSPALIAASHPQLMAVLRDFGRGEGRTVIVLPGAADRALAWDESARAELAAATGATCALALEVTVASAAGASRIRIEPGTRFDERFRSSAELGQADSPLGAHVVTEVLPSLSAAWAEGVGDLADVGDLPRFAASRLLYRSAGRWAWVLLVPFLVALALKLPLAGELDDAMGPWPRRLEVMAALTVVDIVLLGGALAALLTRGWRTIARQSGRARPNQAARAEARSLVAEGLSGLVVSHGRTAALESLGTAFFAATGAACEVVREHRGRLGLPPVFVPVRESGWLEIEGGARLHVRLLRGCGRAGGATLIERVVGRLPSPSATQIVGTWPGESWPSEESVLARRTRVRRRASAAIALAGLLDLASALTPPLEDRLAVLLRWVPLAVPKAATALVALAGLGLIGLAWGVRRGQRVPWRIALTLLVGGVALHLAKGGDVEEAAVSGLIAMYLAIHAPAFTTPSHLTGLRRGLGRALAVMGLTLAGAVVAIEAVTTAGGSRLPIGAAIEGVVERMVGVRAVALPDRLDDFASPSLAAVGVGLIVWLLWLAVRPALVRRSSSEAVVRAREVVDRWGVSTLDYFSLRSDKELFLTGSSVVAYAVHHSVCLVSPDPVGPVWERDEVWRAFRAFADEQGWTVAVLGACESWLDTYRGFGMQRLYVGDEAVVDVRHFSLDGGRHKALRQAVNRVANHGYTVSFADPSTADPALKDAVRTIMSRSRRGEVERGFSMTLGRIFDPDDVGLLLAVCRDRDDVPVAFCQYVPAPGIAGYSLDLMRRDGGDHPNGLLDLVVVRTIEHLREQGFERLGLNFATMRAVLAGERSPGIVGGAQRWALRRMSGSMQIESLWRFNAKFDPAWQARYVVYDAPEHLLAVAFAIARAESFWELPVIGRFLTPAAA